MTTSAPNILLVMSDQHRADMMGCAGDASALTPSLDALAAQGVRFSRVSCQGPLCMPARASFMTERYVRDHGVYTNSSEIPPESPTYAWALREAGYHTALLGKAHLYLDEQLTVRTWTTWPGGSRRWASPKSSRRGTSSSGRSPPATPTTSPTKASSTPTSGTLPTAATGGERGRSERDEVRADVGLDADAAPAGVLCRRLARPAGRGMDRGL